MSAAAFVSLPPEVASVFPVAVSDGVVVPVYQWRAAPPAPAPALLFGHCTGYAGIMAAALEVAQSLKQSGGTS